MMIARKPGTNMGDCEGEGDGDGGRPPMMMTMEGLPLPLAADLRGLGCLNQCRSKYLSRGLGTYLPSYKEKAKIVENS
jgi:hypothetical protein